MEKEKTVGVNNSQSLDLEMLIDSANISLKDKLDLLNEYKNQKNDNIQQPKSPTLKPRM